METVHSRGDQEKILDNEEEIESKSEEGLTNEDPFRVRLKFTTTDYISMLVVFILLVPIRIIVALISLVLAWSVSIIGRALYFV